MSRKWIGVIVAIVLAAIGTWILVRYVQGADNRALEGEATVSVLVIDTPVPAGTPAESISGSVQVEMVPVKVQVAGSLGSVEDLSSLEGLVANVDLLPGEQVIAARFITPQGLEELDDIVIPEGLMEVTLSLSPERAVGGVIRPGDQVAVFASFAPFDVDVVEPGTEPAPAADPESEAGADDLIPGAQNTKTPNTTHIILHKVLVTNVQVEELPQANTSEDVGTATLELSPTGNLLITLAMLPENAERFVFTTEFGAVWLGDEPSTVDETGTGIQDRLTVYLDPLVAESP
ncbi:MAG: RcpC/CpaB family pilus assembly protein [Actinomycetia bacterium]|nr:RcpC/CpaB family pilus assembly protein [Actinomycetes bacterium]